MTTIAKGINVPTMANPTGGNDYTNVFGKIDPAEVFQSQAGVDIHCIVKFYINEAAYNDNKEPVNVERKTLNFTFAEWAGLNQQLPYLKLTEVYENSTIITQEIE